MIYNNYKAIYKQFQSITRCMIYNQLPGYLQWYYNHLQPFITAIIMEYNHFYNQLL